MDSFHLLHRNYNIVKHLLTRIKSFRSLQATSPDIPTNMIQADRIKSVKPIEISPIDSGGFSGNFSAQGALNILSPDERTAQVYARFKYNQCQRTEDKGAVAAA